MTNTRTITLVKDQGKWNAYGLAAKLTVLANSIKTRMLSNEKVQNFIMRHPTLANVGKALALTGGTFVTYGAIKTLFGEAVGADFGLFGPQTAYADELSIAADSISSPEPVAVSEPAVQTPEPVAVSEPAVQTPEPVTISEPAIQSESVVTSEVAPISEESTMTDRVDSATTVNTEDMFTNNNEAATMVDETQLTDEEMVAEQQTTDTAVQTDDDPYLNISDGEAHENHGEAVKVPPQLEDKNGWAILKNEDGSAVAIYSPDDAFSYDELAKFIAEFNEQNLFDNFTITDDTTLKLLGMNPTDINGTVFYDLSEYGLGTMQVTLDENGHYVITPDGTANLDIATGYMTHSYANSIDPDTIPDDEHYKANKDIETPPVTPPEEIETPPVTPPEEIETPIKEQTPEVVSDLPQTGDDAFYNSLFVGVPFAGLIGLEAYALSKRNSETTEMIKVPQISKRR